MARLVPGSQLAGYVIEEQVGAGGMAVVFRARDAVLGRLAALKVLSPALAADQEFRARFLRESQAVASVEEPHIIPVYGAGEVDGVLYIATKFVSGGDLADLLQREGGVLEQERAAMFIGQVASALDAAHAAGLVHRDVKPGNILVDVVPGRGEHAYLSDFGLSKRAMAVSGLTATGTFLGTPDYCAPEQIRGLPVDGRGDEYSLACMAFALLSGHLPFRRQETMATLFAHLNDPVPPLSQYRGGLPPGMDAVLARGLAKEPGDRYVRCGEFAAALLEVVAGAGHASADGTRVDRPAPQTRREYTPPPSAQPSSAQAPSSRPPHVPETAVSRPPHVLDTPASAFPAAAAARPVSRPAPPPPAAGQGGKLPVVSRSAVIAGLAAAAALAIIILLHVLGIGGY
ncbi:serine/threonine protein kinase [Trebonia kvetii]|uniref:non-specific serine/threonine protein kinase n=2 Tax=Trebonia kvetii TaxID=2480626 RepID=A0A6P2CD68_9ACTN|nr:serine/threonine protein kinase [Trebonia kvetii]